MPEIDPNSLISAGAAIIGAITGAVAAAFPLFLMELYKGRKESAQIRAALISEVATLVEIAESREYLKGLQKAYNSLKGQPKEATYRYGAKIPNHYSRIYQANLDRIGILDTDTARKIVQFHQLIDAVVQDVVPGGPLYEGRGLKAFEEAANILERALQLGREISNDR